MHLRLAPFGDAELDGRRGRLHVPVAERLGEQLVDRRGGVGAGLEVAGVRAYPVGGDDL